MHRSITSFMNDYPFLHCTVNIGF